MILGQVDDYRRPLIPLVIHHPTTGRAASIDALIDTGFSGTLLLTSPQIKVLGLLPSSTISGGLADGSSAVFQTFHCSVEWFGSRRSIEAIGGSGSYALVGSALLEKCVLFVDYAHRCVSVSPALGAAPQP